MTYPQMITDPISQQLAKINFDVVSKPQYPQLRSSCISALKSLLSTGSEHKINDEALSNDVEKLVAVLLTSYYNKLDLAEALVSQYHSSNLSYADYLRRSSLFKSTESNQRSEQFTQNGLIEEMFTNFLAMYEKYMERPIPNTIESNTRLKPFRDDINIILSYYLTIHRCVNQLNTACPTQFDVYFASPSAPNDLDNLSMKGMISSFPKQRSRCGLDEIYGLIQRTCGIGNGAMNHRRYVLLIVRGNVYDTNNDVLYLFEQNLADKVLANQRVYDDNAFLWKLHSKQDILPNKLNVDDSNYNLFCISYHLRSNLSSLKSAYSSFSSQNYLYFNGYGQEIDERSILTKWPLLFANGAQQISDSIMNEVSLMSNMNSVHRLEHLRNHNQQIYAPLQSSSNYQYQQQKLYAAQIGEDVFGLRYQYQSYRKNPKQQTLSFPKEVLQNAVKQTYEFDEQQQLYYYLSWTLRMQLIDGEFLHYTLKHRQPKQIAIFNTELQSRYDQETLYVVAELNDRHDSNKNNQLSQSQSHGRYHRRYQQKQRNNQTKPKWKMVNTGFMTKEQIKNIYDIDEQDLPQGSRCKHGYFEAAKTENSRNLCRFSRIQTVRNWNKIKRVQSQQYKGEYPRFNDFDLNAAIKQSVDDIVNGENELIPILNIDSTNNFIACHSLIPIQYKNKWIAASFAISAHKPYKVVIKELYIDINDIINKAILVDADILDDLQWLRTGQHPRSFRRQQQQQQQEDAVTPKLQNNNDSINSLVSNHSTLSNYTDITNQSSQSNQSNGSNSSSQSSSATKVMLNQKIQQIQQLELRIQTLQQQLAMNGNNGNTPPASVPNLTMNCNNFASHLTMPSIPMMQSNSTGTYNNNNTLNIPPIQTTQLQMNGLPTFIPSPSFSALNATQPQPQPPTAPLLLSMGMVYPVVSVDGLSHPSSPPLLPPTSQLMQFPNIMPYVQVPAMAAAPMPVSGNITPPQSRPVTPPQRLQLSPTPFFGPNNSNNNPLLNIMNNASINRSQSQ